MAGNPASILAAIQATLGPSTVTSLTAASDASDLFEGYVFSLVLNAARAEGATVWYENVLGQANPPSFNFRTSPVHIHTTTQPFTHAVLVFQDKPVLEAHTGIYVAGRSRVIHECDVAILLQTEADTCRMNRTAPRSKQIMLAVECKRYSTNKTLLGMARGFAGLLSDISARESYFVLNRPAPSAQTLLAYHRKRSARNIDPIYPADVTLLENNFRQTFRDFLARTPNLP